MKSDSLLTELISFWKVYWLTRLNNSADYFMKQSFGFASFYFSKYFIGALFRFFTTNMRRKESCSANRTFVLGGGGGGLRILLYVGLPACFIFNVKGTFHYEFVP
jgi:hypothetical protein